LTEKTNPGFDLAMRYLAVFFLIVIVAAAVAAPEGRRGVQEQSADALIARARTALGGDALSGVTTLLINASMTLDFDGGPTVSRSVEVSYITPDKFVRVGRYRPSGPIDMEFTYYNGFNGAAPISEVVSSNPGFPAMIPGPRTMDDPNVLRAKKLESERDEFLQMMLPLFVTVPGDFGLAFEAAGKSAYDGGQADVLGVSRSGGRRWQLFFDEKSGLPVQLAWKGRPLATMKMTTTTTTRAVVGRDGVVRDPVAGSAAPAPPVPTGDPTAGMPDVDWVTRMRDHRSADGLNWPRRFTTVVDGRQHQDFRVSRYRINPRIDPKIFERGTR
jgi:hypothetical protein